MREQPLDRTLSGPGEAVLDLLQLFGGVDVDRGPVRQRDHRRQLFGRDGPQRVGRDPDCRS